MIYVFDLDDTLCSHEKDYSKARPFYYRIDQVNDLYNNGHTIIIDTARGSNTGIDYKQLTEEQLKKWGVKYSKLRVGVKFFGDYYVDDKGIKDIDFFEDRL